MARAMFCWVAPEAANTRPWLLILLPPPALLLVPPPDNPGRLKPRPELKSMKGEEALDLKGVP